MAGEGEAFITETRMRFATPGNILGKDGETFLATLSGFEDHRVQAEISITDALTRIESIEGILKTLNKEVISHTMDEKLKPPWVGGHRRGKRTTREVDFGNRFWKVKLSMIYQLWEKENDREWNSRLKNAIEQIRPTHEQF